VGDQGLARAIAFAAGLPHRISSATASLKAAIVRPLRMVEQWGGGVQPAQLWASVSGGYNAILSRLGDPDERGGTFKPFMQELCGEVAACLESAIGHSTQVISDLTDRGAALEQNVAELRQQVAQTEFDLLTRVLNRRGFMRRAQTLAAKTAASGASAVIGRVDLDELEAINARRGHDAGDRALVAVAQRLAALVHKQGFVGRLGGGEFAFVTFATTPGGRDAMVDRVRAQVCQFEAATEEGAMTLSCSIGIADLDAVTTPPQLEASLKRADELMRGARRGGTGRCEAGAVAAAAAA
jgi:diguanylate cyclase (GGDEF)-like protein